MLFFPDGGLTDSETGPGGIKKPKTEDEDILKCFGCKHVYRTLVEIRAHLAAYEKCSTSTWVCDDCPKTFGAERSLRIHTLQVHQTELICDKCAKNFGTDHKKFLRHLQRAHITEVISQYFQFYLVKFSTSLYITCVKQIFSSNLQLKINAQV